MAGRSITGVLLVQRPFVTFKTKSGTIFGNGAKDDIQKRIWAGLKQDISELSMAKNGRSLLKIPLVKTKMQLSR